jgi:hypothetical protein
MGQINTVRNPIGNLQIGSKELQRTQFLHGFGKVLTMIES